MKCSVDEWFLPVCRAAFGVLLTLSLAGVARADGEETWSHLDYPPSPREEARSLLAKRKWAEAAIILRNIVRQNPDDSRSSIDLAEALVRSNRREEALLALSLAIHRVRSASAQAPLIRRMGSVSRLFLVNEDFQTFQDGLHLMLARKFGPAREKFKQVLHDEPANVEVLTRLGQSLVLDGDYDSAAETLRFAHRLNPYEPEIRMWLGRALYERGELSEANEELKAAITSLGTSEYAPVWLAEALSPMGQKTQAIRLLEKDVKENPLHLRSLLALAQFQLQQAGRAPDGTAGVKVTIESARARLEAYGAPETPRFESDLGVEMRQDSVELRDQIKSLEDKLRARS